MEEIKPKIEFEVGSEVSPGHFFKSSFARSFVTNCRDIKSLDTEFMDVNEEQSDGNLSTDTIKSNNYYSLVNFDNANEQFEQTNSLSTKVSIDLFVYTIN